MSDVYEQYDDDFNKVMEEQRRELAIERVSFGAKCRRLLSRKWAILTMIASVIGFGVGGIALHHSGYIEQPMCDFNENNQFIAQSRGICGERRDPAQAKDSAESQRIESGASTSFESALSSTEESAATAFSNQELRPGRTTIEERDEDRVEDDCSLQTWQQKLLSLREKVNAIWVKQKMEQNELHSIRRRLRESNEEKKRQLALMNDDSEVDQPRIVSLRRERERVKEEYRQVDALLSTQKSKVRDIARVQEILTTNIRSGSSPREKLASLRESLRKDPLGWQYLYGNGIVKDNVHEMVRHLASETIDRAFEEKGMREKMERFRAMKEDGETDDPDFSKLEEQLKEFRSEYFGDMSLGIEDEFVDLLDEALSDDEAGSLLGDDHVHDDDVQPDAE